MAVSKMRIDELINPSTGDCQWLYTKGHVDKAEFLAAAESEYGIQGYTVDGVAHRLGRWTPSNEGDVSQIMHYPSKPGRGVFQITILELE